MNRRGAGHQVAEQRRKTCQLVPRVPVREQRTDLWAVRHRDRLVVTHDRDVEHGLQDPELRGEQPVDRRLRGVGEVADRLDGRRDISALDEESAGRVDDGRPGAAGTGLRGRAVVGAAGLDIAVHAYESSTPEPGVILSIREVRGDPPMTDDTKDASKLIDERIRELRDWRGETLGKVRGIIKQADPDVAEEWKWAKATSPGTPVWSHNGGVCTGETYKNVVKLTFFKGAALPRSGRSFQLEPRGEGPACDRHQGARHDRRGRAEEPRSRRGRPQPREQEALGLESARGLMPFRVTRSGLVRIEGLTGSVHQPVRALARPEAPPAETPS